jgi:cytochrome c biogenesis protein CcmG, thiol:disulfide interchange protein DsbE
MLVIDVWASWCAPCSKGFPKLDALAARRTDVVVVAVSIDEEVDAARAFLARFPLGVVVAHDASHALRPPLVTQLPTLLIVDAHGIVRHRIEKPTERDYERLDELLGAPSP